MLLGFLFACADKSGDDSVPADTNSGTPWVAVGEGLDAALLGIWGTAWNDVWLVGADPGSGGVIQHFDGTSWTGVEGAGTGDVWWIHGDASTLWMSGAGGRLFRYDLASEQLVVDVVDPEVILYGVWASSENDAWAVGGNPDSAGDTAVMYHFDGTTWTPTTLPEEAAAQVALFKISGSAADDVWAVGNTGIVVHYDGSAWSTVPTGITPNLFGINGRYAVGGNFTGSIVAWNGSSFVEETPLYSYQFSGVSDDGTHAPTAVGLQGQVFRRGDAGWDLDPQESATLQDLHAVWIDPDGGTWAVGGHLSSAPLIHGVVVYQGDQEIAPLEAL